MRAHAPVFEGAIANRNPFASVPSDAGAMTAGPNGVIVGRFGWADPVTGLVSNLFEDGQTQGFVLPVWGTWQRTYAQDGVWVLRKGMGVTLGARGDFWVRFPYGASAGQDVWANILDGSAAAGIVSPQWQADSEVVTADSIVYTADGGGFQPTAWTCMSPAPPGGLALISSWSPPFSS